MHFLPKLNVSDATFVNKYLFAIAAFDKIEKVVRLPIITPTPCLKIRYLHGGPAYVLIFPY